MNSASSESICEIQAFDPTRVKEVQEQLVRSMILKAMNMYFRNWGRVLWIPHLVLYLLLPVLAGNILFLCVSSGEHVALEFGSNASCCPASRGNTPQDIAKGASDEQQCRSCIDFQLTGSASKATPGRFESLSAQEEGFSSLPAFCPTEQVAVANHDRLPAIPSPASIHSELSTIVLLI